MKNGYSAICQKLNDIKTDHNLTNARWADLSGVPVGTVNRYLSYNTGVPNFPYICAMLSVVGITPNDFYADITSGAESPAETMDLPAESVKAADLDVQQDAILLDSMRERIAQQADRISELREANHEQDAQLRELHAEKRALDNLVAERDKSIARRDERIRTQGRIIFVLGALLATVLFVDLLFANFGWFRFGPIR